MGHIRLGRLPKTRRWLAVVQLLSDVPGDVPAIARATVEAAEDRLRELANDPSIGYCFWLLTRISWASRGKDFAEAVGELGLEVDGVDSALGFVARVTDRARSELAGHPESGPFSELASLAMRRALTETVGQEGRSLFGSSLEDVQAAFRRHSTETRFGALAKSFFGDFLARTLQFFVHKELANKTGTGYQMSGLEGTREFSSALDLYTRQSARIMEQFASEWYSNRNWQSRGRISPAEAQGFATVALGKLRSELRRSELEPAGA